MDTVINLRSEPELRELLKRAPTNHNLGTRVHDDVALVDRRSKWGNPFRLGAHGTREEVITLYRLLLWRRIRIGSIPLHDLAQLNSKRLACWCHPLPCHAHVLARAAAWAASVLAERRAE